jgi:hypothetical protein
MERPIHFGIMVNADPLTMGLGMSGAEKIQTGRTEGGPAFHFGF